MFRFELEEKVMWEDRDEELTIKGMSEYSNPKTGNYYFVESENYNDWISEELLDGI